MDQILFGERLQNARKAAGLSREKVASRLGVKLATVEKWENGEMTPRANRLQTLASLFNVPLMWLLAGSQQAPDPSAGISNRDAMMQKLSSLSSRIDGMKSELEELVKLAENCD